ncbi:hypothetical protein [Nocardioides speluncae]|uniref:hypothetical protein n=1 Tax=Nocardioides speluncae TaxID=2670337 RepID=UPI000D686C91|nr:hypothetical protein [Nocardioides speluncae]
MTEVALSSQATPAGVKTANITAKAGLVVLLAFALLFPDLGHMRDKAAGLRAVGYPLASFAVPVLWWMYWKDRISYPSIPDLLVTITCFTDVLGNRMNLYDTVEWFDDWMHFMNTGFLAAAVVLLTLPRTSTRPRVIERSLAFGATAAIAWEIAEYYAFIAGSTERQFAYTDTLSDLALGTLGALVAACVVHRLWHQGESPNRAPLSLNSST